MMTDVQTIDAYIALYPKAVQVTLQTIRELIQKIAPDTTEAIRYGIPTFQLQGKNLVHFAAYQTHIGFYPGAQAIVVFKTEIAKYKTSKGTIQFPLDKRIPVNLIKKIVRYRVAESLRKKK